MKNVLNKLAKFLFKHKILVTVLLAIAVAAGYFFWYMPMQMRANAPVLEPKTTLLKKTSLETSLSVNGTVQSNNDVKIYSKVSGYAVSEVFVKNGDNVVKGQTIATIETKDLQKEIDKLIITQNQTKQSAKTQLESAQNSLAQARVNLENARNTRDINLANNEKKVSDAYATLVSANADYTAKIAIHEHTTEYVDAKTAFEAAETALVNDTADPKTPALVSTYSTALNALEALRMPITTADATQKAATTAYNTSVLTKDAAYRADSLSIEASTNAVVNANTQLTTATNNLSSPQGKIELETLKEKLADCNIKADISGRINSINLTVGAPTTGVIAVIEDQSELKISIKIKEYDMGTVKIGMKATLRSDATGDKIMTGELISINESATTSTTGDVTYDAKVMVTGDTSGLLIGMNAKVEIIKDSITNVFVVPIDAVTEQNTVFIKTGADFKEVPVVKGLENDFFVEISGADIQEGIEVKSSTIEEAISGFEAMGFPTPPGIARSGNVRVG